MKSLPIIFFYVLEKNIIGGDKVDTNKFLANEEYIIINPTTGEVNY